jgi:hypothetical protein
MSRLDYPHPKGLLSNAGFSQVVVTSGGRTIYTPDRYPSMRVEAWAIPTL